MASGSPSQTSQTKPRRSQRKPKSEHKPKGGRRKGAGRPTKHNAAVEEVLLEAVEQGMSISKACAVAGIHPSNYSGWCEKDPQLETKVEAARARGIRRALVQLHALKHEGDCKAITWYLERMDRETYGPQPPVMNAQQNNFLFERPRKDQVDAVSHFIEANRERMALVRSLRLSDPAKAAEIEAETVDLDDPCYLDDETVPATPELIATYGKVRTQTESPL